MNINGHHQLIAQALVKAVRGQMSQSALSVRLGLNHNHVYKWEKGTRKISLTDFFKICEIKKVDIKNVLRSLMNYQGNPTDIKSLCEHLFVDAKTSSIAKMTEISEFRINKWRSGTGSFYLADFLQLLDNYSKELEYFLLSFFSESEVESLGVNLSNFRAAEFETKNPIFSLLLRLIESKPYQQTKVSTEKFLASFLQISESETKDLLDQGLRKGFLKKYKGKYLTQNLSINMTRKSAIHQRKYWIERSIEILNQGQIFPPQHIFGNLIFTVGPDSHKQIIDEYINFYYRVREIVDSDDGKQDVFLLNCQILNLDPKSR